MSYVYKGFLFLAFIKNHPALKYPQHHANIQMIYIH